MEENALAKNNIVKIFLCFVDGKKVSHKDLVELRAMDEKNCYFYAPSNYNLVKPGFFAKAQIIVYTTDGTYTASERIRNIDFALDKTLYTIAKPKKWEFTQKRVGERKTTSLPVKIEFNENVVWETNIVNISVSGFSVYSPDRLSNLQTKFPCKCTIEFPDGIQEIKAKHVRQQMILDDYELAGQSAHSFRFLNIMPDQKLILKHYMLKLD